MITIGISKAKASLGQLAQAAAAGEVVVLTRRGKPLAEIRPHEGDSTDSRTQEAIAALRAFRRTHAAGDFDVGELVAEGRR